MSHCTDVMGVLLILLLLVFMIYFKAVEDEML